jgi:Fe-S-cluster containining protein
MQRFGPVVLDGKKKQILFKGNCLQVNKFCQAMCCRSWNIVVSLQEFRSGSFDAEVFCVLNNKECLNKKINCMNRSYRLKKKKDGSCIYLNSKNSCLIYAKRPQVCMDFSCKDGWELHSQASVANRDKPGTKKGKTLNDYLMENLKFDMLFVANPLIEAKTLFYFKEKGEIVLMAKIFGGCDWSPFKMEFHNCPLDDKGLLYLIGLFDGRNILSDILRSVNEKFNLNLSEAGFARIVGLLLQHNLIIFKNPKMSVCA